MSRKKEGLCGPPWTLLTVLMLFLVSWTTCSEPPQQLLCVNSDCTGVISTATTLMKYRNPESFLLSFNVNVKVRVLAKPNDPKEEYWGVELNGLYGFVPKNLLRETSILAKPKKIVDVKKFLDIAESLNQDNKVSKNEPLDEEENEDDFEDDEPEEVVRDPTKPPSHRNKKTEQYYKDKRYLEKERKYRKRHTENLEITSTTEDPIISSALPNSDTNINEIHATQSITVIEGTTIYDSIDTTESSVEKESFNSHVKKDTLKSAKEEMKITPYMIKDNVDNVLEISQNFPKVTENNENLLSDTHENLVEESSTKSLDTLSSDNLTPTIHDDNLKNTDDEITKINTDVITEIITDEITAINTDEITERNTDEITEINTDEIPEIDRNEKTQSNVVDSPPLVAIIENQSNISSENSSTETDDIDSDENINMEDSVQKPSSIAAEEVIEKEPEIQEDQNENSNNNDDSSLNFKFLNDSENESNASEETNTNPIIEELEVNSENDTNEKDQNTIEDHTNVNDTEFDTKNQLESENIELDQDFSNFEHHSHIDETHEFNETIIDTQSDVENVTDLENSIDAKTLSPEIPLYATSQTSTDDPNTEEEKLNQESSDFPNNPSESTTVKYNEFSNYHEQQLPLDVESTTSAHGDIDSSSDICTDIPDNDIFDSQKEEDDSINLLNQRPVNQESIFNDDILPSDLLDSNIENERPFILNPVALLNDLFKSLSNIKAYSEKFSKMVNSEETPPKNKRPSTPDKSDHSQNTMPILPENSDAVCTAENQPDDKSESVIPPFLPPIISPIPPPVSPSIPPSIVLPIVSNIDVSTDFVFWLVVSAISVLFFTLGYYYLENKKQDGRLLAMVNTLQKELLCSSKECILLKEELTITKDKLMGIEDSSFGSNEMVICLKKELADNQMTISELQEKLISTEDELANSTEAALELQSILDEQLSAKDTSSSSLAFTITNLQSQLDDQQTTMNLTKAQLVATTEENELLLLKIMDVNSKCSAIEKRLSNTQDSLQQAIEENNNKSQQLQELASNLEKSLLQAENQKKSEVKELQLQIKDLKDELNSNKATLKSRNHELQTLQESVKILQIDENNISAILEDSHTKAELVKITSEKALLLEKFEEEIIHAQELNKIIDEQNSKLSEIKEKLDEADQKTLEATTRLEVLTNYFNQKEADLLKELTTKESLWMSQQGEAMSTVEKIQGLQQEIQQHKETAESIRREVVEQEAAWRAKVAALEQRAHEHWLARRAAERSAEASAREAQTLRQRLAAPSPDKRVVSPLTTGENLPDPSFLPPLNMLPPPPLGFLPPPLGGPMLLPPPLPPHRPPPLGRLSSPPPLQSMRPDRSYSPDSRYSPERAYSPQNRGRSPFSNSESRRRTYNNNRRYDNRYYDSEEDRRSRRYETETDFSPVNTLPPSPIPNSRPHKGSSKFENSDYSQ